MATKVMTCSCANAGQDKLHGKGVRVYNRTKTAQGQTPQWRCTVCGAKKEAAA